MGAIQGNRPQCSGRFPLVAQVEELHLIPAVAGHRREAISRQRSGAVGAAALNQEQVLLCAALDKGKGSA